MEVLFMLLIPVGVFLYIWGFGGAFMSLKGGKPDDEGEGGCWKHLTSGSGHICWGMRSASSLVTSSPYGGSSDRR